MTDAAVHMLVPEGLADWEPGYALAGLRNWGKVPVRTVGFTRDPVTTMGGVRILPDLALAELRSDGEAVRLLLIPGGDLWEGDYPAPLLDPVLQELEAARVPIAAICGATVAVARAGLLRGRRHTSNAPDYLARLAPDATDPAEYVDLPAVRDRGVITASGLAPVEFAYEVFAELGVFAADELAAFLELYKHGRMPGAGSAPAA
jgi:putative intracellular protease/amidase